MRVTGVRAYNANPPLKHTWHVGSNEKLDHVVHIRVLTMLFSPKRLLIINTHLQQLSHSMALAMGLLSLRSALRPPPLAFLLSTGDGVLLSYECTNIIARVLGQHLAQKPMYDHVSNTLATH